MIEDINLLKNRVYLELDDGDTMFSEKAINLINTEIDKLIIQAYKRAEYLLEQNQDILKAIIDALLEKHIMSETELDIIWQNTLNARK